MLTLEHDTHLEQIERANDLLRTITSSQLVSGARTANSPWLALLLAELRKLQAHGTQIPGVGDFRIEEQTIDCVGRVIGTIRYAWLPVPVVGHVAGGGIVVSWLTGAREVELVVFPANRVIVSELESGELISTKELQPTEYHLLNGSLDCLAS